MDILLDIKLNLSKGDFVLNSYLEIVRRKEFVVVGYLDENYCFVTNGRARKLEILFITRAIGKAKEGRSNEE